MTKDDSHQMARYLSANGLHIVECTCGERFKGQTHRQVMGYHFHHAWAKVNERRG